MAIQRMGSGSLYCSAAANRNRAPITQFAARITKDNSERQGQPDSYGTRRARVHVGHNFSAEIRQRESVLLVAASRDVEPIQEDRVAADRSTQAEIERRWPVDRVLVLVIQKRGPCVVIPHVRADRPRKVKSGCD